MKLFVVRQSFLSNCIYNILPYDTTNSLITLRRNPMRDAWNTVRQSPYVTIEVDGEHFQYNPETGDIATITSYHHGTAHSPVTVYKTGRGVVKVKVDGFARRIMDVIQAHYNGAYIRGYKGYPKNGNFSDLRLENIVMVRTQESLFGQPDE